MKHGNKITLTRLILPMPFRPVNNLGSKNKEPPATVSSNASRDPRGVGASAPAQREGSANGTARARITWLRQNAPHEWQSFGKHNVRRRQAEHQETCHMHGNNQNSERSRNEGPTVRWQTALYTSDRNGRCSCKERAETSTKPSRTHLGAAIRLQGSEVAPRWACTRAISREKKKTVSYKRKSRHRCVASSKGNSERNISCGTHRHTIQHNAAPARCSKLPQRCTLQPRSLVPLHAQPNKTRKPADFYAHKRE